MGTITRSHTFVAGEKPTDDQWNVDIDQLFTLVNGNLDEGNVDYSSSDGIVTMQQTQTITGTKTFDAATTFNTSILPDSAGAADIGTASAEWGDVYIADDKFVKFGSDQNVLVGYDETTTDSLKFAATEGAGLAITLMADEGDDAGDEWKLNVADGGVITLGNDIASAGSYVTHLTLTPHATVSSSTLALAGALTVAGTAGITGVATVGGLTIGSAVINEAELETIDGVTAGTVAASKAVVVDSNKDIGSFRNVTLTGELDAATGDFSGDVDVDGTLEADAITLGGTALGSLYSPIAGSSSIVTVGTIGTGTWQGTAVASAYLDADTAHLSTTQTFTGDKTFTGTVTVGVDDTGKDVKFFGASAGAYMEWDESADQLRLMGASADATTSTGKLLLATSLTDINANDVLGKIDFQAPHEAGGTDAITIAASIQAIAQGTFSASVNATDLIFYTGHSEAATEKFRFTSQGELGVGGANYGTDGQVLTSGGAGAAPAWEDASGGSFSGPGSSTDNAVVRFNGTGGATGQNSGVTIDDSNNATGFANLTLSGELDAATGDFSGIIDVAGAATLASLVCTAGGTFGGGYGSTGATISTAGVGQFNGNLTTDGLLAAATMTLSSTSTISGDMTFVDNAKITLGTGGDADIYYNATDLIINPKVAGSGKVGINNLTPTAHSNNSLSSVVIGTSAARDGLSIITATDGKGQIAFGDGDSDASGGAAEWQGLVEYNHSSDALKFYTTNTLRMTMNNGADGAAGKGTDFTDENSNHVVIHGLPATGQEGTIITYDDTNNIGLINAIHTGTAWKPLAISQNANLYLCSGAGNVGIGTTTPDHNFEVEAAGNTLNTFMGNFKTTVGTYNIQVEGTHGGVTGTVLNNYQNSSSPADGDFAGAWNVDYKDDGGNRVQIGSSGWFVTDVSAGTRDSYFYCRVYNNNSVVAGTLSSSGVWTDSSAAAQKEYYGTRQEVWPDGILGSLKTLNVSKYKPANQPEDKPVTETHVSPTAEDFLETL